VGVSATVSWVIDGKDVDDDWRERRCPDLGVGGWARHNLGADWRAQEEI
jgi:hypothetical protein